MPVPYIPPSNENAFKPRIGTVTANGTRDYTATGKLLVTLQGAGGDNEPFTAHSVMAWGGRGHGAFGPVEPLSNVMLLPISSNPNDPNSTSVTWYWIGVIPGIDYVPVEPHEMDAGNPNESKVAVRSTLPESDRVYALDKTPTKTIIKNIIGHKLELAETVFKTANGEVVQDDYAMLTTNSNKYIKLDAGVGPTMDRIIITDEKDNRIVIKTGDDKDSDPGWGPESITIECTGNMHLLSKTGEMDVRVGPESTSNITIHNEGTGDIITRCEQGNIYVLAEKDIIVQSDNVHVTTKTDVTITAEGGNIKAIADVGNIDVEATVGNITATCGGDLTADATKSASISAKTGVTITDTASITNSATLITLDGNALVTGNLVVGGITTL